MDARPAPCLSAEAAPLARALAPPPASARRHSPRTLPCRGQGRAPLPPTSGPSPCSQGRPPRPSAHLVHAGARGQEGKRRARRECDSKRGDGSTRGRSPAITIGGGAPCSASPTPKTHVWKWPFSRVSLDGPGGRRQEIFVFGAARGELLRGHGTLQGCSVCALRCAGAVSASGATRWADGALPQTGQRALSTS